MEIDRTAVAANFDESYAHIK